MCVYTPSCSFLSFLLYGQNGSNALHYAAQEGHLAVVKYLIEECGFNPDLGNKVSCCVYVYILYVVSTFSVVCT